MLRRVAGRYRASGFLFGFLLLGSVAAWAEPPAKSSAKPSAGMAKKRIQPVATPVVSLPEPPLCSPKALTVTFLETDANLTCDAEGEHCAGELQLAARNCTGQMQTFVRVELYEGQRRVQVLEWSPASIAPPNRVWREGVPWKTPGELIAEVFYRPPSQGLEQSVRVPLHISNKALAAAKAECVKCQGVWGRYGVNKSESCNCKPRDAGQKY